MPRSLFSSTNGPAATSWPASAILRIWAIVRPGCARFRGRGLPSGWDRRRGARAGIPASCPSRQGSVSSPRSNARRFLGAPPRQQFQHQAAGANQRVVLDHRVNLRACVSLEDEDASIVAVVRQRSRADQHAFPCHPLHVLPVCELEGLRLGGGRRRDVAALEQAEQVGVHPGRRLGSLRAGCGQEDGEQDRDGARDSAHGGSFVERCLSIIATRTIQAEGGPSTRPTSLRTGPSTGRTSLRTGPSTRPTSLRTGRRRAKGGGRDGAGGQKSRKAAARPGSAGTIVGWRGREPRQRSSRHAPVAQVDRAPAF